MDWAQIRAHFATLAARTGLTQHLIAERGGLKGQGVVSKLLANAHLGPSVETFVRAVIGTGTKVSAFFAAIERDERLAPADLQKNGATRTGERLHELEMACAALAALLYRDGRANGEQDDSPTPRAELDLRRVEAIVQASTARILADIALLEQPVASDSRRPGVVPPDAPNP